MGKRETNMASEYFVMSSLYRLGADPNLTIGDKKAVDIIVKRKNSYLTIDVKGATNKANPPINYKYHVNENHYYIFVFFKGKILDISFVPEVFIVPSIDIKYLVYKNHNKKRATVYSSRLFDKANKYKDNWKIFIN